MFVTSDGGNDGNIAFFQQVFDGAYVHVGDFTHISQRRIFHFCSDHVSVHTGNTHGAAAVHLQQIDQRFIDFSRQHHLHNLCRFSIRHTQPVDKFCLFAHALQCFGDFRATAVHQNDFDAYQREQHNVFHHLLLAFLIDHRVATVFDDNHFIVKFLDIGQCFCQDLCPFLFWNVCHESAPLSFLNLLLSVTVQMLL